MSAVTAKVVWLDAPGELVWREESLPTPGPGEVMCETIVSAISPGTELAAWRGDPPLRPGNPYPRVQGYCNVAKVVEVGEGGKGFARVGEYLLTLQSHRSHFLLSRRDMFCRVNKGVGLDQAATAYLFHLGYNALLCSNMRAGHRVVVIGLGVLGLASVALARLAGARVIAVSDQESTCKIAMEYGATETRMRAGLEPIIDDVDADIVILTTNGWDDFRLASRIAGLHGIIACLGFPGRGQPPGEYNPLAAEHFYNKQLRIEAVGMSPLENDSRGFNRFNVRDNLGFLMQELQHGRLDPAPILSGRYSADAIAQAYADLDARKDNAITYLLDWTQ